MGHAQSWRHEGVMLQPTGEVLDVRAIGRPRTYIGIDPGASGGIAAVSPADDVTLVVSMPPTDRDILDVLAAIGTARAVLEFVRSSP